MLKTVVLLHISVEFFLKILWWIEISKEHNLFEIEIFCILKDLTYPKHLNIKQHNLFNIDIHCILKYIKILYISHYEVPNVGSTSHSVLSIITLQAYTSSVPATILPASLHLPISSSISVFSPYVVWGGGGGGGGGGWTWTASGLSLCWGQQAKLFTINYQNQMGRRTRKITILLYLSDTRSLGEQKDSFKTLKQS